MSSDDALDVPDAKSSRSTRTTLNPCGDANLGDSGADDPPADDKQTESFLAAQAREDE